MEEEAEVVEDESEEEEEEEVEEDDVVDVESEPVVVADGSTHTFLKKLG